MSSIESRVWVEPLRGIGVPVGSVLIIYSTKQHRIFEDVLKTRLDQEGIPYFLDKEQIKPGDEWFESLNEAYKNTSCGIPILTPTSIKSPWVLFEIGVLCGKGKKIIPFLSTVNLEEKQKAKFLNSLPEFVSRFQWSDEPDKVIDSARKHIFYIGDLSGNRDLDKRIIKHLIQLKLTLELENVPERFLHSLNFGYQIVRFGRWEFQQKEPYDSGIDETDRLHKIFYRHEKDYLKDSEALKIDFVIPVHRKWGTTFKLFVDTDNLRLLKDIEKLLIDNGLEDVKQSGSGEKQRVYFLIPEKCEAINVVTEPYENIRIVNNNVFPV